MAVCETCFLLFHLINTINEVAFTIDDVALTIDDVTFIITYVTLLIFSTTFAGIALLVQAAPAWLCDLTLYIGVAICSAINAAIAWWICCYQKN